MLFVPNAKLHTEEKEEIAKKLAEENIVWCCGSCLTRKETVPHSICQGMCSHIVCKAHSRNH